jgi:hypothetical protein
LRLDLGLDEADIAFGDAAPAASAGPARPMPNGPGTQFPSAMPQPSERTQRGRTQAAVPPTAVGGQPTIAWPATQQPVPQTLAAAAEAIPRTGFVRTPGTDAPPAPLAAAGARPAKRGPLLWIGLAAAAAVAVAVGVFVVTGSKDPSALPETAGAPGTIPPSGASAAAGPAPVPSTVSAAAPTVAPPTAQPMAPSPISTPAADAGAFDVVREFDRIVQAQSPGFRVEAKADKTTLKIDRDELAFTLKSEREGFVYVFIYGADKVLMQLYPNIDSGSLRIKKGETMKLPQGRIYLQVTEPPGPGQVLAMVSNRQRDHSDLKPRMDGGHRYFATGAESAQIAARHTGPLPVLAGRALCPPSGPCDDAYGAAVIKVETVR